MGWWTKLLGKKEEEKPKTYNEQKGWDSAKGEYVKSPWTQMVGSADTRKRVSAGFKRAK